MGNEIPLFLWINLGVPGLGQGFCVPPQAGRVLLARQVGLPGPRASATTRAPASRHIRVTPPHATQSDNVSFRGFPDLFRKRNSAEFRAEFHYKSLSIFKCN